MGADYEMDDFNLAPANVVYAGEPVPAEAGAKKDTGCASCCYFTFGWMFLVFCGFGVLGLVSSLWFFAVPPNWGLQYELLPVEYGEPMTVAGVVPGQYYALYQVDLSTIEEDSQVPVTQMSLCVRSFGNPNIKGAADVGFVPNVLFDPYANKEFEQSFDSESSMLADYQFWEGRTLPACATGRTADLKICNKNQKVWIVVENTGKEDTPAPFEVKLEYNAWESEENAVCFDELSYDTIFIVMIVLFAMLFCSSAICTSVCCSWFCLSGTPKEDEEEAYMPVSQQPIV
mmetsp:Transcript_9821/g.39848  ORF Transcript_9821/g.39848 Transcript_9821/m.39848 type:complete len:287 (+) Transcript_9821:107-967(+)|eukprot:CAMPEP_0114611562 /NCGR_PEP_ID=MMETSP0168-20121206/4179_1 /TAXON_ID=95228 ORGANISM="Vannella sp., Strain DIVA3 517/6/12" /NCGR_SAMPLE_ID=MMETSP0168 /ASSEMBLY_ACC=CAM_ASM_000044 /LENGTH=286 /DNA_ID=CAMNT_0001822537 /DNA_START=100 /DNA_END=960 /DNA_ORIENTATION=-